MNDRRNVNRKITSCKHGMEKKVLQEPLKSEKLLEIIDTPPPPNEFPRRTLELLKIRKNRMGEKARTQSHQLGHFLTVQHESYRLPTSAHVLLLPDGIKVLFPSPPSRAHVSGKTDPLSFEDGRWPKCNLMSLAGDLLRKRDVTQDLPIRKMNICWAEMRKYANLLSKTASLQQRGASQKTKPIPPTENLRNQQNLGLWHGCTSQPASSGAHPLVGFTLSETRYLLIL